MAEKRTDEKTVVKEEVSPVVEFYRKVSRIQSEVCVPKSQRNNFGKYNFRNLEDILAIVKPLLAKEGLVLLITDEVNLIGTRFYLKSTATITDGENSISSTAWAREEDEKKGMDGSQITGAASSYARKIAVGGLLEVSGSKDMDTYNTGTRPQFNHPAPPPPPRPDVAPVMEVLKRVNARIVEANFPSENLTLIIQQQFGKTSRELSLDEAVKLEKNLDALMKKWKEDNPPTK